MPPPHPEGCQTSSLPLPPILGVPPPSSRAARPRCPLSPLPPSGYPSPRPPGCVCVCVRVPPPPPPPPQTCGVRCSSYRLSSQVLLALCALAGAAMAGGAFCGEGTGPVTGGSPGTEPSPPSGSRLPPHPRPPAGSPAPPPPKKNLLPAARRGSGAWRARHFLMARGDDVTRDTRPASPLPT